MKRMRRCLACSSKNLRKVIDLGKQPLANNYGQKKKYPLATKGCFDCGHMQLTHSVNPKTLYSHYLYESGTSKTLNDWFKKFAKKNIKGSVLDIASNDGSFLRACKPYADVLGIDPAKNLVPQDIPTITGFFSNKTQLGKFDRITAFNVVAHTPNPLSIVQGIKNNLTYDGLGYIMTSQTEQMKKGQFDTIYHEHHSYFTPHSMRVLCIRAGLEVVDQHTEPIHGNSLMTVVRLPRTSELVDFSLKAKQVISRASKFKPKHRMVGIGAAAKGVVFINATGLKPELVMDEAVIKQGHTIPGTDIVIVSIDKLQNFHEPLTIVYLAWNFRDELERKVRKLRWKYNDQHIGFFK
jgi:hypothetical protein